VTVDAVVAPAARTTWKFSAKASPVPSAPSATTLPITGAESRHGTGGAPATSGAMIASCAVATSSWAVDRATPVYGWPARYRRMYGNPKP